jgi:hypothetical protein
MADKELIKDIRSGMSNAELIKKHGITPSRLNMLLRNLPALDDDDDVQFDEPLPAFREGREGFVWVCPACKMPQEREFNECPQCGVLVSKFARNMEKKAAIEETRKKKRFQALVQILSASMWSIVVMIFVWLQGLDVILVTGSWKLLVVLPLLVFPWFFLFFLWLRPWDWKDIHG